MLTSNLDDVFAEAEEACATLVARCEMLETALTRRPPPAKPHRQRKARKPTLVSVARQANRVALAVARYEIKPDGTVVIVTGKSEPTEAGNPWLADLDKVTKQ